jgi:hypothetical protein
MDFEQAKHDIEQWIRDFVEKPNPALNNWAPCPYARQARLANTVVIVPGSDPYFDLVNHWRWGMQGREVVVLVYDPAVSQCGLFGKLCIDGAGQLSQQQKHVGLD